jgi:hypothetical protein
MNANRLLEIACFIGICALGVRLSADDIHIYGGDVIKGTVTIAPRDDSPFYVIRTDDGVMLKLARNRVSAVRAKSEELKHYEQLRAAMDDTIEQHLNMAEWCRENRLAEEREFHLLSVLRLDPNQKDVRAKLGFAQRKDGRWMSIDQLRIEQGYVRQGTRWVPAEWVKVEEAEKQARATIGSWNGEIKKLRSWLAKSDRAGEAITALKAIDDPAASVPLAEALLEEKSEPIQELFIEVLGKLNTNTARKALIVLSMESNSPLIRESCLTVLKRHQVPGIVDDYIRGLNPKLNPNNVFLNRAAIAIGWFDSKKAIRPLIDALVTEHAAGMTGGSPGNIGFSSDGSFSAGGSPKQKIETKQNRYVLQALQELTGENFEYNQEAWQDWFARSQTPPAIDLRRNP